MFAHIQDVHTCHVVCCYEGERATGIKSDTFDVRTIQMKKDFKAKPWSLLLVTAVIVVVGEGDQNIYEM